MNRQARLFIITHLYPLAMVSHMKFGDWCTRCQLIFNFAPFIFIFLIIAEWKNTSGIKLHWAERQSLNYFVFSFAMFHLYYCACALSSKEWVKAHNNYFFWFILLTGVFYIFTYAYRKWQPQ
jgi:hypothetical protein